MILLNQSITHTATARVYFLCIFSQLKLKDVKIEEQERLLGSLSGQLVHGKSHSRVVRVFTHTILRVGRGGR